MQEKTLCLLVQEERILLGMKKRGFGKGYYNGFGGKRQGDESVEQAAVRELKEEAIIYAESTDLIKSAELTFIFPHQPEWNQKVYVYILNQWKGQPRESEEMTSEWFPLSQLPYEKMWPADRIWLPLALRKLYITATFVYGENREILEQKIETRPLS